MDVLNVGGLLAIGLALFLGCFLRLASLSGILLLLLYYFAHPPFGTSFWVPPTATSTSSTATSSRPWSLPVWPCSTNPVTGCRPSGSSIGRKVGQRSPPGAGSFPEPVAPAESGRREALRHRPPLPAALASAPSAIRARTWT
ncbi:MAG: hypothetical protein R2751_11670 [Bacteroidales bacterium]